VWAVFVCGINRTQAPRREAVKNRSLSVFLVFLLLFSLAGIAAPTTANAAAGVVKLIDPATGLEKAYYSLAAGHNMVRVQVTDSDLNVTRTGRARVSDFPTVATTGIEEALGSTAAGNSGVPFSLTGANMDGPAVVVSTMNAVLQGETAATKAFDGQGVVNAVYDLDLGAVGAGDDETNLDPKLRARDKDGDGDVDVNDVTVTVGGVAKATTTYTVTLLNGYISQVTIALATDNPVGTGNVVIGFMYSEYDQAGPASTPIASASVVFGASFAAAASAKTVDTINNTTGTISVNSDVAAGQFVIITFGYDVVETIASIGVTSTRAAALGIGRTLTLTETGAGTGIFGGNIQLTSDTGDAALTTPAPGRLIVSHGDTITVTYSDANPVATVSDTALVDLKAPVVTLGSPTQKSYTNAQGFTFSVDVTDADSGLTADGSGVALVSPTLVALGTPLKFLIPGGFRLQALPTANAPEGKHEWGVTAQDSVGNDIIFASEGKTTPTLIAKTCDLSLGVKTGATLNETITLVDNNCDGDMTDTAVVVKNPFVVTVDILRPRLLNATTGVSAVVDTTTGSATLGKYIDDVSTLGKAKTGVRVVFDPGAGLAPLDATSVSVADFRVGAAEPLSLIVQDNTVYLTVSEMGTDAKPLVDMVGTVSDKAGNALTTAADAVDRQFTALDGLKPVITVTVTGGAASDPVAKDKLTIVVKSGEPLGNAPAVNVGVDVNGDGDLLDADVDSLGTGLDELVAKADLNADTDKADIPSVSEAVVGFDLNADGDLLDSGLSGINETTIIVLTPVTMAVQATNEWTGTFTVATGAMGRRTVRVDGADIAANAGSKSAVLEMDTKANNGAAPTLIISTLDANNNVSTPNPWITIAFAGEAGEYGATADTHKTVTLSTVTLDAVDNKAAFFSADNITYTMAASGLALGKHTIAGTFADEAGNTGTFTKDFTVIAKPATQIPLGPGWNLVSVPGPLDDPSISSVFAGMTTVQRVYGFDPTVGWQLSTFDAATGKWSGSLAEVRDGQGYWVFSSANVPIKVFTAERQPTTPLPQYNLKAGWNLIGFTSVAGEANLPVDSYTASLGAGTGKKWTSLVSFNPNPAVGYQTAKGNAVFSNGFDDADGPFDGDLDGVVAEGNALMVLGKGYWIFLSSDGTLVP